VLGDVLACIAAQILGGNAGALLADAMLDLSVGQTSTCPSLTTSEIVDEYSPTVTVVVSARMTRERCAAA
jgi:glycerol uptake facilitator-like aquaporin